MIGRPAHRGGRAAYSRVRFGPTLASVVLSPLLSEFHVFRDRISSCCCGVLLHTCFPVFLYAQHVETNTYPKRNRE